MTSCFLAGRITFHICCLWSFYNEILNNNKLFSNNVRLKQGSSSAHAFKDQSIFSAIYSKWSITVFKGANKHIPYPALNYHRAFSSIFNHIFSSRLPKNQFFLNCSPFFNIWLVLLIVWEKKRQYSVILYLPETHTTVMYMYTEWTVRALQTESSQWGIFYIQNEEQHESSWHQGWFTTLNTEIHWRHKS